MKKITTNDLTEEKEMILLAQRFPQAYERIYNAFYEQVFRFVHRRTDDESLTGDLVSQVFLKGMLEIGKYEYRGISYLAWLYRTASNEINGHYRKQQRRQLISIHESDLDLIMTNDHGTSSERKRELIIVFLERLTNEEVLILELKYYENRAFKEIAYIINKNESAVKMKLYRALDKLKKMFDKEGIRTLD